MKNRIIILVLLMAFFYVGCINSNFERQYQNNLKNNAIDKQNDKQLEDIVTPKSSGSNPLWKYTAGGDVYTVDISSDGKYIVAGSYDNKIYLFSNSSSTPLWNYNTGYRLRSVAISSNGSYIVAGGYGNKTYLFHKSSSTPIFTYDLGGIVNSVSISSDGNYFVAGTYNNKVCLFNKSSSMPMWIYNTNAFVTSVVISSDGNYIAAADSTGSYKIYLFNKSSSTPMWNYSTGYPVPDLAISTNGFYIVASCMDNNVYLFNKSSSIPMWNYSIKVYMMSIAISSDGNYIAAGAEGGDNKIYLFHKSSSAPLWNYTTGNRVDSLAFGSDDYYLVAGSTDGYIYLFNRFSSTPLWSFETEDNFGNRVYSVAISHYGDYIVAGTQGGFLYLIHTDVVPSSFNLSSNAGASDFDGKFNIIWNTSEYADNYSIYTYDKFITEINDSLTLLNSGITDLNYTISGLGDGRYYYKVVSYNDVGNRSSNCISVDVKLIPQISFDISDFYLNTTRPLETDLGLEIKCKVLDPSTIKWVYVCENSTGSFVNRSLTQGKNNLWNYSLDISSLVEGNRLMFSFYANNSFGNIGYQNNGGSNFTILIDDYYIDPILIDGNDDFTSQNGVRNPWAAGTIDNPYIIENWIIDGGSLGTCIDILNSDVFFIIRNCTVFNSQVGPIGTDPFYHAGIRFYNVSNAKIIENNCSNNRFTGIRLYFNCNNNEIIGNIANNNPDIGIFLRENCNDNIILNNICNNSGQRGISLYANCDNNLINGNAVNSSDKDGIYIINGCDNNIIFNNTISSNQWDGILILISCINNKIFQNKIINNQGSGINIEMSCNGNTIYYNQITDNNVQATDEGSNNNWDSEGIGNIWSDYTTKYPSAGNNGVVWNISYEIDGSASSQDNYPLCSLNPMIGFRISSDYLNSTAPLETDVGIAITCSILNWYNLEWVYLCENSEGVFINRSMNLMANGKWMYIVNILNLSAGDVLMFSFYAKYNPIVHFDNSGLNYSITIRAVSIGGVAGGNDDDADTTDIEMDWALVIVTLFMTVIGLIMILILISQSNWNIGTKIKNKFSNYSANHPIKKQRKLEARDQKANRFEILIKESEFFIKKGKRLISREKFSSAVENWMEAINFYSRALEKAPSYDEDNLKILRENICDIYIKFLSIDCTLTKGLSVIIQDNKIITKPTLGLNIFLKKWLENRSED